jgi:hypothetical protein
MGVRGTQMGDMPEIPAMGKRMEVRGASILEFADGKIRRVSDYWDRARFRRTAALTGPCAVHQCRHYVGEPALRMVVLAVPAE